MNSPMVGRMAGVLLAVAALAGCSSTSASPQALPQPSSTTPTTAVATDSSSSDPTATGSSGGDGAASSTTPSAESPSTSPSAPTPSSPASTGTSVTSLLAKWGTGGTISTNAMPTADPAWVRRLQPGEDNPYKDLTLDAQTLNLVALVDEAAREGDIHALVRLSNGSETAEQLSRPGLLTGLTTLLEKTHPASTDGFTYPGFTLTGGPDSSKTAKEDAAALGLAPGAKYQGVTTYFRASTGPGSDGSVVWTGAQFAS